MLHFEVNCRRKDQRKNHRAEQAADDGNGERLQHLRASPNAQSKWEHSSDGGEGRHGDGTETAAAGLKHSVLRRHARVAEGGVGIEEQDAVFRNHADDHDHAHEGSDVEGGSGYEERDEPAESRENSGGKNRDGSGEGAKFEKQDSEEKQKSEEENFQKFAEGPLLFLILASVFDADGRRQMEIVDSLLDGGNGAAEADSFQAGRNHHEALEIFAADFRFAGSLRHARERAERGGFSCAADEQGVGHAFEGRAICFRKTDADCVGAVVLHDGGSGGSAFENG